MPHPSPFPLQLTFSQAPATIRERVAALARPVVVIGITGPVGAGKSLLASRISPCIIATDNYLPNYDEVEYHERDLPEKADYARLAQDLIALKRGSETSIPRWSFHTHRREGYATIQPHPIIICEGIHALHDVVLPALDIRVFVDAPAPLRLARWEAIALRGERGWGIAETREFFHTVADPTFNLTAEQYRSKAHLLVGNDTDEP